MCLHCSISWHNEHHLRALNCMLLRHRRGLHNKQPARLIAPPPCTPLKSCIQDKASTSAPPLALSRLTPPHQGRCSLPLRHINGPTAPKTKNGHASVMDIHGQNTIAVCRGHVLLAPDVTLPRTKKEDGTSTIHPLPLPGSTSTAP